LEDKGFTLVELLVVVAIIVIIGVTAMNALRGNSAIGTPDGVEIEAVVE